jgi:hypothetical protein
MSPGSDRIIAERSKLQIHSVLSDMITKQKRSASFSEHDTLVYRFTPEASGVARSVSLADVETSIARKTGRKEWRDIASVSACPWGESGRFIRYEYNSAVLPGGGDEDHVNLRTRFDIISKILRNIKFNLISANFDLIIDQSNRVWLSRVTDLLMVPVEVTDDAGGAGGGRCDEEIIDEAELFKRIDSARVDESLLTRMGEIISPI